RQTPEELVRNWRREFRNQQRQIDSQIRNIVMEENKIKVSLKQAAKKGDKKSYTILAKELLKSRDAKNKLDETKNLLNSMLLSLQQQLSTIKITGTLKKTADIMHSMNQLSKIPEISQTIQKFSNEMTKAGIIDEMISNTLGMNDEEGIEEEAEEEVEKVLFELTNGLLGEAGSVGESLDTSAIASEESLEEKLKELQS
ncbi:Snf7-domain-containing protein, partial [Neocallimastix sp. 'constans']